MIVTKKITCLVFCIALFVSVNAQEGTTENKGFKYNNNFDLALATNGNQSASALSWVHFFSINKKKKFKIGYGVRFTSQIGKNLEYYTAPAKLTSKQEGPQVLFSEIYYENIDTFKVSNAQNNLLNLSINLQYTIKEKFDIGFNIDAIGFSFGKKIAGSYSTFQDGTYPTSQAAKPTTLNALLVSDNDIGALNSELYCRYWFKPKWALKVGASFLFTEYTTTNQLRLANDRWRNKALMGMIGVSYKPF